MFGRARRPEAETVVMLGSQNQRAGASGHRGACPLPRVETGRREDRWVLPAIAPFTIRERIDAEVEKERELLALPRELRRRWAWTRNRSVARAGPRRCARGHRAECDA